MSAPLSVLMAVRDGERYLPEAIRSVLTQTVTALELVVVDDASTDRTPEILRNAARDPRVRVLRLARPVGQTVALNRALALVAPATRWIGRIDADDAAEPTRFERQIAALDRDPSLALVGSWTTEIAPDGEPIRVAPVDVRPERLAFDMGHRNPIYHSTWLARRELFDRLGGYDASFRYAQDHELVTRAVMQGHRLSVVPEPLVRYRRGPHQVTHRHRAEQERCSLAVRQRHLAWLTGRRLRPESADALRALLTDVEGLPLREVRLGAGALVRCVARFASSAPPDVECDVRRFVRDRLLWQSWRARHARGHVAASGVLLRAALAIGPVWWSSKVTRAVMGHARAAWIGRRRPDALTTVATAAGGSTRGGGRIA